MIKKPLYFCAKAFFMNLLDLFLASGSVSTDSRKVKKGDLFFALKGENFDGNKYARQALSDGAAYAIVDDEEIKGEQIIHVEDVLLALQTLARDYRRRFTNPVLAITGSNGKTTTKELTAAVISKKYKPLVTVGNLNNHIGVPLTLLAAKQENDFFIIEMGANHQGEIDLLCRIAEPQYGVITNIGRAHLEGFGGVEGIKRGKSEMYRYLSESNATIFLNKNDDVLADLVPHSFENLVHFNPSELSIIDQNDEHLSVNYRGNRIDTQLFGTFNVNNIAVAIAIGEYFGIGEEDIINAIQDYCPGNNRSQILKFGQHTIIKDAYNANPSSVEASVKSFIASKSTLGKGIVLGDMLELGEDSPQEHLHILQLLEHEELDLKVFIGPRYAEYKDKFKGDFYLNVVEAKRNLDLLGRGDALMILIKGSRGIAVEKILE